MPSRYIVKTGDTISSIAYEHGFYADTVWGHTDNADLRQKRKDPDRLLRDDVVIIPDKRPDTDSRETGARHRYLRRKAPSNNRLPLRLMIWNIHELGGGFFMPHERPEYVIESYATLIKQMDVDICVIQGLTRSIGEVPECEGTDEHPYLIMKEGPQDTGPKEVLRILEKLKAADPGGDWQAQFFKSKRDGKYIYHYDSTTCLLHRTIKSISFVHFDLIDSGRDLPAGLTGKVLCATFEAPEHKSEPVHVMAPLGTHHPKNFEGEIPAEPGPDADLMQTRTQPSSALMAVSAPGTTELRESAFQQFKPTSSRDSAEGTTLREDFWHLTVEKSDKLLETFVAVDRTNMRLHDENMHWEAMDAPKHATTQTEVMGPRADTILICGSGGEQPLVEELRPVNLIKASVSKEYASRILSPGPSPDEELSLPQEDHALASGRTAYRKDIGGPEPEKDVVNELAECCYFSLALSTHWPVVTQLRLEP